MGSQYYLHISVMQKQKNASVTKRKEPGSDGSVGDCMGTGWMLTGEKLIRQMRKPVLIIITPPPYFPSNLSQCSFSPLLLSPNPIH